MAYSRPGVYVSESALKSSVSRRDGTSVGCFIGGAARGPAEPTLISSWSSYVSNFGNLENQYDLGYAVYHYFANGGRQCYVTRAVSTSASVASTAASAIAYEPSTGGASASLMTVEAASKGVWGNDLTVYLTSGLTAATSSVLPTFNISVRLNGTEVESWSELSPDVNNSRYVATVINTYSTYIRVKNVASVTANSGFSYISLATNIAFANGSNGAALNDTAYTNALDALAPVDGALLINVVMPQGYSTSAVINAALNTASSRGDSFVIIDPVATSTVSSTAVSEAISAVATYTSNSGYGAVYYPMLKMVDPAKSGVGAIRDTFPGGAIAGIYSRMEVQSTVAKAPAGFTVQVANALGLATTFTDTQIGTLYDSSINAFKAVPGAGISVVGARTLAKVKPDKFITIRRSLNYVKASVKELTQFAVFEPNDERLWTTIESRLNKFLSDFWGAGGLRGRTSSEAFYVICDETNNDQTTIDAGEVKVEIGVSLLYPAEFIIINVSQWIGGTETLETI